MDDEAFLTNLSSLKEMILDEEKPVTYITISKELCLHVNAAKLLLKKVVEDIKKSLNAPLNICYIISGLKNENNATTKICSETELLDERKSFQHVFFEHIYGVNKCKPLVGNGILSTINRFEDFTLCQGLIKNNTCSKRSSEEIGNLKSNSQQKVNLEAKNTSQVKIKEEKKNINGQTKLPVVKIQESKSEPTIKPEKSILKDSSPKTETSLNKKSASKNSKGIAGFFTKSNSFPNKAITTPKESIKIEAAEPKKTENEVKIQKMETEDCDVKVDGVTPKVKKLKTEPKQNGTKNKTSNEKLEKIRKVAKVDKKRKRLLHVSDSESDDEGSPFVSDSVKKQTEEMEDSEDEIPPTPTVNTVKITSGITNPKKRRKIVDKTYTDEEGYILTKKVEVYESCSDNEDEVKGKENKIVEIKSKEVSPKEKQQPKAGKKKISPPQKGKQATLTKFFKTM